VKRNVVFTHDEFSNQQCDIFIYICARIWVVGENAQITVEGSVSGTHFKPFITVTTAGVSALMIGLGWFEQMVGYAIGNSQMVLRAVFEHFLVLPTLWLEGQPVR
jgi:hypothetical protein